MSQEDVQRSTSQRFWELICAGVQYIFILFILSVILLILSLLSLVLTKPGTGSRLILYLDIFLLGPFTVVLFFVLYRCELK